MTARRLTKQIVDELVPRDTDYVVWCGKLPGFGCRVRTTGHKSFIVMYRAGGRNATPRKVTIGVYGKLTVEQARELGWKDSGEGRAWRGRSGSAGANTRGDDRLGIV